MIAIPKSMELTFKVSANRSDIYEQTGSHFKGFTFVRLSEPRSLFLIKQGAKYVIESWDHGFKPLFTGLRVFSINWYYGDYLRDGKRSLMIVRMNPGELIIHLFRTYPRKNLQNLLLRFPATKNSGNHPGVKLSPTEPESGLISPTKINYYPL